MTMPFALKGDTTYLGKGKFNTVARTKDGVEFTGEFQWYDYDDLAKQWTGKIEIFDELYANALRSKIISIQASLRPSEGKPLTFTGKLNRLAVERGFKNFNDLTAQKPALIAELVDLAAGKPKK